MKNKKSFNAFILIIAKLLQNLEDVQLAHAGSRQLPALREGFGLSGEPALRLNGLPQQQPHNLFATGNPGLSKKISKQPVLVSKLFEQILCKSFPKLAILSLIGNPFHKSLQAPVQVHYTLRLTHLKLS